MEDDNLTCWVKMFPLLHPNPSTVTRVESQLMREKGITPNEYSYTAAVNACATTGNWELALKLLGEMRDQEGLKPNDFAYTAAVSF